MKKKYILAIAVVASLGLCWVIGQYTHRDVKQENQNIASEAESVTDENVGNTLWDTVVFEGNVETADNPWNMTAGWFDMEGEGKCILLNPNTAVVLENIEQADEIRFSYEIHPWVRKNSDGAGLLIWLMDENDDIILEQNITVLTQNEWKEESVSISGYESIKKIKILCNNGENGNDNADWVVIKEN